MYPRVVQNEDELKGTSMKNKHKFQHQISK